MEEGVSNWASPSPRVPQRQGGCQEGEDREPGARIWALPQPISARAALLSSVLPARWGGGGPQVRFHIREWPQDNDAKDPKSRRSSGVKVLVQTHSAVPQAASMCAGGHRIMDGASPHAWHFSAQLTQPAQGTRASPDPCVSCGLLSSHERS